MPAELVTTILVVVAVPFGLWIVWYVLPWLIDRGGEPDDSFDAYEIIQRVEQEGRSMNISLADADQWRMAHRNCAMDGSFRSLEQARFVANIHSGHGPSCKQYLSATAYSFGLAEE
ncbi:hypothetical protein IU459_01235 [Nocardia amamiensis]|uniref:Uncharacterized protein n=1 Tax=Nocardia amamiensis TaxID=404578 RepID=A0ABS0CK09_9NOCA|nr:hypothetical protein [Nocardia amamiensis]MBF6296163.1 hypothetical protein [Nocardia amamiensis]